MPSVAIVGSGPAGFYVAEALNKRDPALRVDLIERLPTPYGLVRSGVAPDHQSTKAVVRVFKRIAQRARFVGNVEVGRDVRLSELLDLYDAVILANGAPIDRSLGIEGETLPGVYGSGAITSWINGHPDYSSLDPELRSPVAIIGNGNVALDVARVLGRSRAEMRATDIPAPVLDAIERADLRELHLIGRRGPLDAAFTPVELRELGELTETVALADASQLPMEAGDPKHQRILESLRGYAQNDPQSKRRRVHLHFYSAPARMLGVDRVRGIEIAHTRVIDGRAVQTDERTLLPVETVITAIGYLVRPFEGVPIDPSGTHYAHRAGRIDERLWCAGWAARGPSGVIATNRHDSAALAAAVVESLPDPSARAGPSGLDRLLAERGVEVVPFDRWEKIDALEIASAVGGAPRRKLITRTELLSQ
jgi:NADPH-dependent glutamate synthase beta subunit-like oxidoreductase